MYIIIMCDYQYIYKYMYPELDVLKIFKTCINKILFKNI